MSKTARLLNLNTVLGELVAISKQMQSLHRVHPEVLKNESRSIEKINSILSSMQTRIWNQIRILEVYGRRENQTDPEHPV